MFTSRIVSNKLARFLTLLVRKDGHVFAHDFVRQIVSVYLPQELGESRAAVGREHALVAQGLQQLQSLAAVLVVAQVAQLLHVRLTELLGDGEQEVSERLVTVGGRISSHDEMTSNGRELTDDLRRSFYKRGFFAPGCARVTINYAHAQIGKNKNRLAERGRGRRGV